MLARPPCRHVVPSVLLTVSDSGIGISPADLPHVFERFYRADQRPLACAFGGCGLGLSIAQYIAQAHGGQIDVFSEGANRGTTFSVRLPLIVLQPVLRCRCRAAGGSIASARP